MTREAVVLVPGLIRTSRTQQREELVEGLRHAAEDVVLQVDAESNHPPGSVRLKDARAGRIVDVYEAYWNDLVPSLSQEGLKQKVIRGTSLLLFWGFSGIWRGFWGRKYLTAGLIMGLVVLLSWYLGVLFLFFEAVEEPVAAAGGGPLAGVVATLGNWQLWLASSILVGLLPVALLVDIMDFSKIYISTEIRPGDTVALRHRVRSRVREQVHRVFKAERYDRVTFAAHSFGSVVAVDLLADLPRPTDRPVSLRLITLGSPLELLARKSAWLEGEVERCAARDDLEEWVDLNASGDWFASGVSRRAVPKIRRVVVPDPGSLPDRIAARVHSRYFDNDATLKEILAPARQEVAA